MIPNVLFYFRLLRHSYEGLEILYDLSKKCACPYLYSLRLVLDHLGEFSDNVHKDILSGKTDNFLPL